MDPSVVVTGLSALGGAVVGGLISYFLQKQKNQHELSLLREQNKTEFMAETTARHYLDHKGYTDRSFEVLESHLGGFNKDELRKILVRAGAVRVYRDDGSEWWTLLDRLDERIEKLESKKQRTKNKTLPGS